MAFLIVNSRDSVKGDTRGNLQKFNKVINTLQSLAKGGFINSALCKA